MTTDVSWDSALSSPLQANGAAVTSEGDGCVAEGESVLEGNL